MDLDIKGIEKLQRLAEDYPKASARALNRTMLHVRTKMTKDVRQQYNIKSSELKSAIPTWSRAVAKKLAASFSVKGRRFKLVEFVSASIVSRSLAQVGRKIKSRPTIRAKVSRGKAVEYKHAFAAKMKSGHVGVFWRTNKPMRSDPTKQAIEELTAPSAPQMFLGVWERLFKIEEVRRKLYENLAHEIEYAQKKERGEL